MDATDDKVNLTGNILTESSRPIRLGDAMISRPHICGFFNSHDDEYRVLLPFIRMGSNAARRPSTLVESSRRIRFLCLPTNSCESCGNGAKPDALHLGRKS